MLVHKVQFPVEYGLFIAANVLDLFLTMAFIEYGGGEANPLAKWVLFEFGKAGFIAYKLVLMLVVIALCEFVAPRRRTLARALIWLGIVLLTVVVISTAVRYVHYMRSPEAAARCAPLLHSGIGAAAFFGFDLRLL